MRVIREAMTERLPGFAVGLMRIMLGVMWLDIALQKAPWVVTDGHRFGWLHGWIEKEIAHPTFGIYRTFLETVVLPNFTVFGYMSFAAEIAIGLSLAVGLFTVLGGVAGGLWQLNIALGSYSIPGEWYWLFALLIVPHFVVAHARAGRVLGLDQLLLRLRRPVAVLSGALLLRLA